MSALGQKQTFALQNVMSALAPKADIRAIVVLNFNWAATLLSKRCGLLPFGNSASGIRLGPPSRCLDDFDSPVVGIYNRDHHQGISLLYRSAGRHRGVFADQAYLDGDPLAVRSCLYSKPDVGP